MQAAILEYMDGGLHVCIFNIRIFHKIIFKSYFKIEILVKSCSPPELSIN